jgi:hypothetical protein
MVFTRTLRLPHLYIFPIFYPRRLTTDTVWLVLVLDWSPLQSGTLGRGICMALDHFVCLGDNVHPPLLLDEGPLVNRS